MEQHKKVLELLCETLLVQDVRPRGMHNVSSSCLVDNLLVATIELVWLVAMNHRPNPTDSVGFGRVWFHPSDWLPA